MIYTCTLNPSIDYVIQSNEIQLGVLNTSSFNDKQPGGKGINVSRMIHRFGVPNKSLGFMGGFTGEFIVSKLKEENISTDFIWLHDDTRINIKIKAKEETEINGVSPFISKQNWEELLLKLDEQLQEGDYLVLSGSIPSSLKSNAYSQIAERLRKKNIHLSVDVNGENLKSILPYRPFLIKPNHHELGDFFNVSIKTTEEAKYYGRKLVDMGVSNVIISMASEGAILLNKDMSLHANVPSGTVANSVGAGDSLVGGFLATYSASQDIKEAFRYGVASGSATAFSLNLGEKALIDKLYQEVKITTI